VTEGGGREVILNQFKEKAGTKELNGGEKLFASLGGMWDNKGENLRSEENLGQSIMTIIPGRAGG